MRTNSTWAWQKCFYCCLSQPCCFREVRNYLVPGKNPTPLSALQASGHTGHLFGGFTILMSQISSQWVKADGTIPLVGLVIPLKANCAIYFYSDLRGHLFSDHRCRVDVHPGVSPSYKEGGVPPKLQTNARTKNAVAPGF